MPYPDSTYEQQWRDARRNDGQAPSVSGGRSWSLGTPGWGWPDDVDVSGTEAASGYRYIPVMQTDSTGYRWEVARVNVDECDADQQRDARLMAAAPDLLAALDSIRSSLMELDDDGCGRPGCGWREMDATHVDELISNSLRLAIDVIAKAEGSE
jgi:hypothetical protein